MLKKLKLNSSMKTYKRTNTEKDVLFITEDWNAKVRSQKIPGVQASLTLEYKMKQDKGWQFLQGNTLVTANTLFQQQERWLYTWTSPEDQYENQTDIFFAAKDGKALYSQQKQDWELTEAHIMNSLLQNSALNWKK